MQRKKEQLEIGFASSMFQTSGASCGESNWTQAAKEGTVPDPAPQKSHWDNIESDLDLFQKTGINSYRFSVEWSHIEPKKGQFDNTVLARYNQLIEGCLKRNIKPMITLYHFNEPLWFTRLGSFENEENINYFVCYCKHVFEQFSNRVKLWCTINEPAVQAYMGYCLGDFPPHRKGEFFQAANFLKNLLKAHVAVYYDLKECTNGQSAQIGIVHNILRFVPLHQFDPIAYALINAFNPITNTLVMEFFKTGSFEYRTTFSGRIHYADSKAPHANDFFGLNFYANPVVGFNRETIYGATCREGQQMGDMFLAIDPQGFANAIDEVAVLNKPIYITETGIADKSDTLRQQLIPAYLNVVRQKNKEGKNVVAVYLWTPINNYEWAFGFTKHFGFFDQNRKSQPSLEVLKDEIRKEEEASMSNAPL